MQNAQMTEDAVRELIGKGAIYFRLALEYNSGNCNGGWQRQAASILSLFSLAGVLRPPLLWVHQLPYA